MNEWFSGSSAQPPAHNISTAATTRFTYGVLSIALITGNPLLNHSTATLISYILPQIINTEEEMPRRKSVGKHGNRPSEI
jgi:hypothetical protein